MELLGDPATGDYHDLRMNEYYMAEVWEGSDPGLTGQLGLLIVSNYTMRWDKKFEQGDLRGEWFQGWNFGDNAMKLEIIGKQGIVADNVLLRVDSAAKVWTYTPWAKYPTYASAQTNLDKLMTQMRAKIANNHDMSYNVLFSDGAGALLRDYTLHVEWQRWFDEGTLTYAYPYWGATRALQNMYNVEDYIWEPYPDKAYQAD